MQRRAEVWAGMMDTLPDSSSTSWTLPGLRPGKETRDVPKQQRPSGLSAVSKTEDFSGG